MLRELYVRGQLISGRWTLKNQSSSGDPRQPEHAAHTYTNILEIASCWEGGRFESNASTYVRSDFKVLLMTHKIVNVVAPSYRFDLIKPYIPPWALRSQNTWLLLELKRSQLAAPFLWNNLPSHIRQPDSIGTFKSKLKSHFFTLTFN